MEGNLCVCACSDVSCTKKYVFPDIPAVVIFIPES